jgi:hypothetical protein
VPPTIDGRLDDPCWSQAARLEGWGCIDVDQEPPEQTTALICVDDTAIYLAVICHDRTPDDLVATETRRNGDIWTDDFVFFGLDPWHAHKAAYSFIVTARGTQAEDIPGGSAAKIQWRGDWRAAAIRTPTGWQAELAIPFSILQYPLGQTTFGFVVGRHFARERISSRYPAEMGVTADPYRAADLVGLHVPPPRGRPVFLPHVTFDLGESARRHLGIGLDVKEVLPNGLTALGTLNPDFTQIEDVVEPISFSYTERYLPDLRPFFVTGEAGYLPPDELLYTRRIQDFDAGVKLFGTLGRDTVGFLDALSVGGENALAAAWRHSISESLQTQVFVVSHREDDASEDVSGGLSVGQTRNTSGSSDSLWFTTFQSQGEGSGGFYSLGGGRYCGVGKLRYAWSLRAVTEGFDPSLGYNPDRNYFGGELSLGKWDHFATGPTDGAGWSVSSYYYPHLSGGGILTAGIQPEYSRSWRNGQAATVGLGLGSREGQANSDLHGSVSWNTRDLYRHGSAFILAGRRLDGKYTYASLYQGFQPARHLYVGLGTEYSRLAAPSPLGFAAFQSVVTGTYDVTPEKSLSVRVVWRNSGASAYAAFRQVVRRGTDMYVILGDPNPERTGFAVRLAVKLVWTI